METGVRLERLRAEIFRNFAGIFLNLPDLDFARAIADDRFVTAAAFDSIMDIAPKTEMEERPAEGEEVGVTELLSEGLADIQRYANDCKGVPLETVHLNLGVERTRLVRGLARGYGPPPPYGMNWKTPSPESMGRLDSFYNEMAFSIPNRENPTYIGVELAFLSLLCERIAEAEEEGADTGNLSIMREEFLRDDVLAWVPAYLRALIRETNLDFFRGVAKLLLASLKSFGSLRQVPIL